MDGNNLESILVITWHRQAAFQIQYGIFSVNSDEVKQTEQDVPNPSERSSWPGYFISTLCRIYASVNWVSIDSGNGFSPVRCQVIT